jgi:hypothetical protein
VPIVLADPLYQAPLSEFQAWSTEPQPPKYAPSKPGFKGASAKVIPYTPSPSSGSWRVQAGAYGDKKNAADAVDKVFSACGILPSCENDDYYYRVVLRYIDAADIPVLAEKLGPAGFKELLVRKE